MPSIIPQLSHIIANVVRTGIPFLKEALHGAYKFLQPILKYLAAPTLANLIAEVKGIPPVIQNIATTLATQAVEGRLTQQTLTSAAISALTWAIADKMPANWYKWLAPILRPDRMAEILGTRLAPEFRYTATLINNSVYASSQLMTSTLTWGFQQQMINFSQEEQKLRDTIVHVFSDTPDRQQLRQMLNMQAQESAITQYIDRMFGGKLPLVARKITSALDWIFAQIQLPAIRMWNWIMKTLVGRGQVRVSDAPSLASALFSQALQAGLASHALSTVSEIVAFFSHIGFNQIAGFISKFADFDDIIDATLGEAVYQALKTPMRYYIASLVRTRMPGESLVMEMAVKPDISIHDFRVFMRYMGYSDAWIQAIEKTMYREPRYFELSFMLEDASTDERWLYKKARRAGYAPDDAAIFVNTLIKKTLRTERSIYRESLFRLYKEGYITDDVFDSMLDVLELRPEAHALLKKAAELQYLYDYISETRKMITDALEGGLISEHDARLALAGLGLRDDKINLIINSVKIKLQKRIAREVHKRAEKQMRDLQKKRTSLYIQLFRAGTITLEQLREYLRALGLTDEFVDIIVETEKVRMLKFARKQELKSKETLQRKIQRMYKQAYIEQFREGLIDKHTLIKNLIAIGITEEEAKAIADIEEMRAYEPEPQTVEGKRDKARERIIKLYKMYYTQLFRKELISADQFLSYLLQLGLSEEEAKTIVNIELVRRIKKPKGR